MKILFLILLSQISFATDWPPMSIYHLDGLWKNSKGKEVRLSDLAGKPLVAAMVYTSCQHVCPIITGKIQKVRESVPKNLQKKARFVLISFDPVGDKPSVLRAYKKKHKLDKHWVLLTGDELEVRKVAGVFGVNYKKTPDGDFSHSNVIALFDKKGVIVSKVERLDQSTATIVKGLKALVK